ncbi:SDR family oxidoreductase [Streptomyces syringium]|uniref:SDR family oxidoreductase n=1 Tax=Streptomyces syringium TaxID=76729 RepID=UPI0036EFA992
MRSVVVTGASSGIGSATAIELARRGYDVLGTVRTEEKAKSLVAAAAGQGRSVRTVLLDVADPRSCTEAFAHIEHLTGGGPWAVVNNAGVELMGAVEDVSEAEARYLLEVNLFGALRMCRLALPAMRGRGAGRIVNVTSHAGLAASPFNGWYAASKHALEALSDSLRMESARYGVRVSVVEPGFHETPMVPRAQRRLARLAAEGASPFQDAYEVTAGCLERLRPFRGAEEAARVVCRAVSARRPRARYLTGRESFLTRVGQVMPPVVSDAFLRRATGLAGSVPARSSGSSPEAVS